MPLTANSMPFVMAMNATMLPTVESAPSATFPALAERDMLFKAFLNPAVVISPFLHVFA